MKKITILMMALFMSLFVNAQYYYLSWDLGQNPGGINTDNEYPVGGGLPGGWTTQITGPSTAWSGDVTLPFTFNFNGTDYTTCKVAPGFVTFGNPTTFPGTAQSALPNSSIPDNTIAIWGLTTGANDYIVTKTFGSNPNRQFWIQMNTAGNAGVQNGWAYWSIVLEEGTNNIYIVDQRNQCVTSAGQQCTGKTAVSAGIQIDGTKAISINGSPSLQGIAGNDPTPGDNVYYTFIQGTQPNDDIMMVSKDLSTDYAKDDGDIKIIGQIRNIGKDALQSFDLNYSIDGGATVTQNVTGVNIASGDYYSFDHATPFSPAVSKKYGIKIWTSNPNGKMDANTDNDEVNAEFTVHDKVFVRKPLYEIFTSSTCGPCNPGNTNFHNVIDGKEDDCVYIKYQQSWPGTGDPYCTAESNARRTYYSINSIPRMEIDGGWDGNASSFTSQMHTDATNKPAFVDITATTVQWGKHVELSIEIDPAADFSGNNTLHAAIMERVTYDNIKTNGESEFTHVMKKMMTGASGINLGSLTKDNKVTRSYTWDFKGDRTLPADGSQANWINHNLTHSVEDFENLFVAVWIQNNDTKDVLQATYATQSNVGVIDLTKEGLFTVYPNPASESATVSVELTQTSDVTVNILNVSGQTVSTMNAGTLTAGKQNIGLDLAGLTSGIYYVQLNTDAGLFMKPVTVK